MMPSPSDYLATTTAVPTGDPLVSVRNVVKVYALKDAGRKAGTLTAVDDVSFDLSRGSTLGLVGESGSGKSTTAMIVGGLTTATSGEVIFQGKDITRANRQELRELRRHVQVVFQDPHSSLDPRMSVQQAIAEPLYVHKFGDKKARGERVRELLELVGLRPEYADRHPHQLSGGQAQRVSIARALALEPSLVILDEPIASLDLSIQAQILNLLQQLQDDLGLSYLFIGHDLAAVAYISDRIAVMNTGRIVELGPVQEVYERPRKDYTRMLLDAALTPDGDLGRFNQRR